MSAPTRHFLVIFDPRADAVVRQEEYAEEEEALRAFEAAEREFRDDHRMVVTLLGSDSLETVRRTHRNLFGARRVLDETIERFDRLAG